MLSHHLLYVPKIRMFNWNVYMSYVARMITICTQNILSDKSYMAVFYGLINSIKYRPLTANNCSALSDSFVVKLIHSMVLLKSLGSPTEVMKIVFGSQTWTSTIELFSRDDHRISEFLHGKKFSDIVCDHAFSHGVRWGPEGLDVLVKVTQPHDRELWLELGSLKSQISIDRTSSPQCVLWQRNLNILKDTW